LLTLGPAARDVEQRVTPLVGAMSPRPSRTDLPTYLKSYDGLLVRPKMDADMRLYQLQMSKVPDSFGVFLPPSGVEQGFGHVLLAPAFTASMLSFVIDPAFTHDHWLLDDAESQEGPEISADEMRTLDVVLTAAREAVAPSRAFIASDLLAAATLEDVGSYRRVDPEAAQELMRLGVDLLESEAITDDRGVVLEAGYYVPPGLAGLGYQYSGGKQLGLLYGTLMRALRDENVSKSELQRANDEIAAWLTAAEVAGFPTVEYSAGATAQRTEPTAPNPRK
jgi:hypothetical protein